MPSPARLAREAARRLASSRLAPLYAATARDAPVEPLPVELVEPSPFAPQGPLDLAALRALIEAVQAGATLEPVSVWRLQSSAARWTVLEGELRRRAALKLGHRLLPAHVVVLPDQQAAEFLTLVQLLRRHALPPSLEGDACRRLLAYDLSQDDVARGIGFSRGVVTHALHLRDLPDDLRHLVDLGALSRHHARPLRRFNPWPHTQRQLARRALCEGWSCAQLECERPEHYGLIAGLPEPAHPDPDPRPLQAIWLETRAARHPAPRLDSHLDLTPLGPLGPDASVFLAIHLVSIAGPEATLAALHRVAPSHAPRAAALIAALIKEHTSLHETPAPYNTTPTTVTALHNAWRPLLHDLAQEDPNLPLDVAAEAYILRRTG